MKSRAGGIFIAIGMLAGGGIGIAIDQPSVGMLAGLGLGILAAIAMAVIDRRR